MNVTRVYPYVDQKNPEPQKTTWGVFVQKNVRDEGPTWPSLEAVTNTLYVASPTTPLSEVEVRGGSFVFQRMETATEAASRWQERLAYQANSDKYAYEQYLHLKERFDAA